MKATIVSEPELEFSGGRHVDPRFGLMNFGPLDLARPPVTKQITVGVIGTPETIEGVTSWLERCKHEIAAKDSRLHNLFPMFPGFHESSPFKATVLIPPAMQRAIPERLFRPGQAHTDETIAESVELFVDELRSLTETGSPDVVLCAVPFAFVSESEDEDHDRRGSDSINFHDLLKARAMGFGRPIQIVLPSTYDDSKKTRSRTYAGRLRELQDPATRAWNFHVALYYKSGWAPWRLVRKPEDLSTCYLGIAFYRAAEPSELRTSMAQIFNERGQGVVIRGGPVQLADHDRQPHLSQQDSEKLVQSALMRYRTEHKTLPARIVIHKTSVFTDEEFRGCMAAITAEQIHSFDLLSISQPHVRLFRGGAYPPLRGTLLTLDERNFCLYTRGSVDFFATYPGMYVPWPLEFHLAHLERTPTDISTELLALTKMNWNNAQLDGREPITIHAARRVGRILRYVPISAEVAARYSFYM